MTEKNSFQPISGPQESPGFLLWHTTLRWQRLLKEALKPLGLTHVQFVLLASLWWLTEAEGKQPSQRELADHAGTDRMMTSQVLRALEQKKLITRSSSKADSRVLLLAPTKAGVKLAQRAVQTVEAADREFFMPTANSTQFIASLRKLANSDTTAEATSKPT